MRALGILTAAVALACTGFSGHMVKPAASAHVAIAPTAGNSISGTLDLTTVHDGVRVHGQLTGLVPASIHGFHIHEKGDCSAPDGSSAGGHFNPLGMAHGNPITMPHHAGDIPNQTADTQGVAKVDVVVHGVSLGTGASDDVLGRSVVVHKDRDDYTTQPAGNSGARVACGVITKAAP
jgi:Cu-Zn family superoxide dismutase